MKTAIRYGALVLLVLIAAPLLARLAWAPQFTAPVMWGVAYVAFRLVFPPRKRTLVAPIAISVGLLSLQILTIVSHWGRVSVTTAEVAVMTLSLVWLFLKPSRIPAAVVIMVHVAEICAGVYVALTSFRDLWWILAIVITMRIAAVYLTADLVWGSSEQSEEEA